MDRETWWAVVRGVAKSWTRLSDSHTRTHTHTHTHVCVCVCVCVCVQGFGKVRSIHSGPIAASALAGNLQGTVGATRLVPMSVGQGLDFQPNFKEQITAPSCG